MSLTETPIWHTTPAPGLLAAGAAAVILIWLYIHSSVQWNMRQKRRLDEVQESLYIYARLAGPLSSALSNGRQELREEAAILRALQECKAAPYLTPHLTEQIQACLRDLDSSRLSLLHKSLEREMSKLMDERSQLLRASNAPGWGLTLWRLIRPALLPAATVGIALLTLNLARELWQSDEKMITLNICVWIRFVSCLIAILYLYSVLTLQRREVPSLITNVLSLTISILAIGHLAGLTLAPYILGAQILLFLLGFKWIGGPTRKDRPYVGHPDLIQEPAAQTLDTSTQQDTDGNEFYSVDSHKR